MTRGGVYPLCPLPIYQFAAGIPLLAWPGRGHGPPGNCRPGCAPGEVRDRQLPRSNSAAACLSTTTITGLRSPIATALWRAASAGALRGLRSAGCGLFRTALPGPNACPMPSIALCRAAAVVRSAGQRVDLQACAAPSGAAPLPLDDLVRTPLPAILAPERWPIGVFGEPQPWSFPCRSTRRLSTRSCRSSRRRASL